MKKFTIISGLIFALFFSNTNVNATVWRVNSAPGSDADYTSIQAAHDAATTLNGDTLYIEGNASGVGGLDCSKQLIIIGTGYFIAENPETQASPLSSQVSGIRFLSGSEGSKLMGIYCNGSIQLQTSDIFITRCFVYANTAIQTAAYNVGNIVITQSYISSYYGPYYSALYFPYSETNILISNCYLYGTISSGQNFSGIFTNNVVYGSIDLYNSILKNNILYEYGSFTDHNCVYTNNISFNASFGTANGNQSNVNMGTVFVGATGNSTDGQWMLKAGSPALGAGENGVDCGMFGGAFPYILSGMPNIPSIYYLNTPAIPSSVIDVAIKAKSNN